MVALYIIAGIIAFFALLLSLNASLRVIFDSSAKEDMKIYAKIGFFKINIIPLKPKKEKKPRKIRKKKAKPSKAAKEKPAEPKPQEKRKLTIPAIFEFVKDVGSVLLKRSKKHFRVKIYRINVILGSDEAQKTALMYGAAIQSAYYLFEFLEHNFKNNFKIHKKTDKIKIIPDFSKTQTSFYIDIKFYMRLSHILALSVASAMKFLRFWNKIKQQTVTEGE